MKNKNRGISLTFDDDGKAEVEQSAGEAECLGGVMCPNCERIYIDNNQLFEGTTVQILRIVCHSPHIEEGATDRPILMEKCPEHRWVTLCAPLGDGEQTESPFYEYYTKIQRGEGRRR